MPRNQSESNRWRLLKYLAHWKQRRATRVGSGGRIGDTIADIIPNGMDCDMERVEYVHGLCGLLEMTVALEPN
jgi:hypothetical protein